jgi:hypothetical protein
METVVTQIVKLRKVSSVVIPKREKGMSAPRYVETV